LSEVASVIRSAARCWNIEVLLRLRRSSRNRPAKAYVASTWPPEKGPLEVCFRETGGLFEVRFPEIGPVKVCFLETGPPLVRVPRCGDVFVFCGCLEDLFDKLGDLRRQETGGMRSKAWDREMRSSGSGG
jgi:hypothetical protein